MGARSREDRMGVRVDKTRHHDLPGRVDLQVRPRMPGQHICGGPDVDERLPFRVQGPVLDDAEFVGRLARPRACRASHGQEFRRLQDEEGFGLRWDLPRGRTDLVRPRSHRSFVTPAGSDWTMKAFPPARRMASAVTEGRSVKATMLPPPPAPVSLADYLEGRAASTRRSWAGCRTASAVTG